MNEFYDTEGFDQSMDVSASGRKFQTSVIVKQDASKTGILSFLSSSEDESVQLPKRSSPQTVRPSRRQGGY